MLGNSIIEKTSFKVNMPVKGLKNNGKTAFDGRIYGYINGRVEGTFHGTVEGSVDVNIVGGGTNDSLKAEGGEASSEGNDTSDIEAENKEEDSNEKV